MASRLVTRTALVVAAGLVAVGVPGGSAAASVAVDQSYPVPASRVTTQDRPDYRDIDLERPELYFSPEVSGYALARTDVVENPCGDGATYAGTSGVEMSSLARRGEGARKKRRRSGFRRES